MSHVITIVVVTGGLLSIGGCAKSGGEAGNSSSSAAGARSQGPALEETRWTLVALGDKPAEVTADEKGAPYIMLWTQDKRVSGSTGVNFLGGAYTLQGDSLKFGRMITTRRAGPPALMQQETEFTRALERTAGWRIHEGNLELLDADGTPAARFRASGAATAPANRP